MGLTRRKKTLISMCKNITTEFDDKYLNSLKNTAVKATYFVSKDHNLNCTIEGIFTYSEDGRFKITDPSGYEHIFEKSELWEINPIT